MPTLVSPVVRLTMLVVKLESFDNAELRWSRLNLNLIAMVRLPTLIRQFGCSGSQVLSPPNFPQITPNLFALVNHSGQNPEINIDHRIYRKEAAL